MMLPLRELVRSSGLVDSVRFLGRVPDPWIVPPDVYVHPSEQDGLPLALLEAMARGLPVVASRIAGIPEVVRDGENGYLVPPGDAQTLARRIAELIADRERAQRLGGAARTTVLADWGIERTVDGHIQLYSRLLEAGWP
jgi:glycosyltransferase involved in cell wall biosynthesis